MVLHQQLQSVNTLQPSGSDLFTETNTRLIECIFCVEKKLREVLSPALCQESQNNGNQDLCSHTGDFDTLKAGMRSKGLTSQQSSREPTRPSDGAELQRNRPQTSKYAAVYDRSHNWYVSTRTMVVHRRMTESRDPPGAKARTVGRSPWLPTFQHCSQA